MSFNEFGVIESKNATISASSKTGVCEDSRTSLGGLARVAGLYSTRRAMRGSCQRYSSKMAKKLPQTDTKGLGFNDFFQGTWPTSLLKMSSDPWKNALKSKPLASICGRLSWLASLGESPAAGLFWNWWSGLKTWAFVPHAPA
jgi:hypothetical protein